MFLPALYMRVFTPLTKKNLLIFFLIFIIMPMVVWGELTKSAIDSTKIEEEIDARITSHNEDPDAHGLADMALYAHRSGDVLDHIAESVKNIKIQKMARAFKFIVDAAGEGDYTTIQPAIDAANAVGGGRILIKAGTYVQNTDLVLYSNIELIGEDDDVSIIDFNHTAYGVRIGGESANYKRNIKLTNLTIKGSRKNSEGAVYLWYVQDSSISECYFTDNNGDSITWLPDVDGYNTRRILLFRNRHIESPVAVSIVSSQEWRVEFSTIKNATISSPYNAIYLSDVSDIRILENILDTEFTQYGIKAESSSRIIIKSNYFRWPYTYGIYFSECNNSIITGNILYGGTSYTDYGIYLTASNKNIISNNWLDTMSADGIFLVNSDHNTINGNYVAASGGWGINISDAACDYTLVISNQLRANTSGGVQNLGTGSVVAYNLVS